MPDKPTQPSRATRTVKIGDNHHKLLRILASFAGKTMQETFELCVEQAITDFFEGRELADAPLDCWDNTTTNEALPITTNSSDQPALIQSNQGARLSA